MSVQATYSISRSAADAGTLIFSPPINSPDLALALELAYPFISTHKERTQQAVLDFFLEEKRQLDESQRLLRQKLLDEHQQLERQKLELERKCKELEQALEFVPPVPDSTALSFPAADPTASIAGSSAPAEAPNCVQSLDEILNFGPEMSVPAGIDTSFNFADLADPSSWLSQLPPITEDQPALVPVDPTTGLDTAPFSLEPSSFISPPASFQATPKSTPALEVDHDVFDFFSETACVTPAMGSSVPVPYLPDYFLDAASLQLFTPQLPLIFDNKLATEEANFLLSPQVVANDSPVHAAAIAAAPSVTSSSNPTTDTAASQVSETPASASTPDMEAFTSVWSLSTHAQPKRHTRRTMTESEKKEYRIKRQNGACADCRRRRRKCTHPVSAAITPRTPALSITTSPVVRRQPVSTATPVSRTAVQIGSLERFAGSASSATAASIPRGRSGEFIQNVQQPCHLNTPEVNSTQAAAVNVGVLSQSNTSSIRADHSIASAFGPENTAGDACSSEILSSLQSYSFASQESQSWFDPGLFSPDLDDRVLATISPSSRFQPYSDPPRVSRSYVPQSLLETSAQTSGSHNTSHLRATDSKQRSHHLISQTITVPAPSPLPPRPRTSNVQKPQTAPVSSFARILTTASIDPATTTASCTQTLTPTAPKPSASANGRKSAPLQSFAQSANTPASEQELDKQSQTTPAPAVKSSSPTYSLQSSMGRWRYLRKSSKASKTFGRASSGEEPRSRALASETKWRSNPNNSNEPNNLNPTNEQVKRLPLPLSAQPLVPSQSTSLKSVSPLSKAARPDTETGMACPCHPPSSELPSVTLALVSLVSRWSDFLSTLGINARTKSCNCGPKNCCQSSCCAPYVFAAASSQQVALIA